ncbi:Cytidylate kinase [Fundidesulfovibrio magnetotacticus]|uniref:Cytidylate kinase n=1 Tax=Fundidesulfovibrio magnetotacticus TaxID=2730080 RepID=A0A6V8M063_9BACT|nr:(d)CMP kinase [Fundidesulfovibrio magnetotacticus]GFK95247.1 Cytidylate kinase [Fundidesulfovibrio magnetotacticus]
MAEPLVVTMDGPAGVGKSTLARMTAQALGIAYLDTGAMFRATALALGEGAWDLSGAELEARLPGIVFGLTGVGDCSTLLCNGAAVGDEVRTEEVGRWASLLAVRPEVRARQLQVQRSLGLGTSLVAEGRDMGTVVFPAARRKFFLDASPRVRALRRVRQLEAMGQAADAAAIEQAIRERDRLDRERPVAPLVPAPDAVIVDTSELTLHQVFERIMDAVRSS